MTLRERVRHAWRRWRSSLDLLLGRRLWLFAGLDGVIVLWGIGTAFAGGEEPRAVYTGAVVFPLVVLGLPAMADVVALERRAGSLDLALASPHTERYFLRRVATVAGFLALQGALLVLLTPLAISRVFPVPLVLVTIALVNALAGVVVLFWAVRIRGYGGVWMASLLTMVMLGRWAFRNPVPEPAVVATGWLLPEAEELARWGWNSALVLVAIVLFLAYARRRLRRAEGMLR